jgi:hypothetical protein
VSNYANIDWKLYYAAADAKVFGDTLKAVAKDLYARPLVIPVPEEEATAKGIESAIESIESDVKPYDVFVLYLAGHGLTRAGTYYFLPQDLRPEAGQNIKTAGISQDMLEEWLAKIPAQKSVVILDTCQSASAIRGESERETAIDRLQHATGRSIITAASDDAHEGYRGHGLLTFAILEELTKSGGSGEVSLLDVAEHVKLVVPRISLSVWGVRQDPHYKVADNFPLGVRVAAPILPAESIIPLSPAYALLRSELIRQKPADDAPVSRASRIDRGTQVRVIKIVGTWALIAREGQELGYIAEKSLLRLQQ